MWLPKWRRNAEKKGGERCHLKLYWTELNWTRFLFWYSFKASFQRQFTVRRGVSIYSISIQDSKIFYLALFSPQGGIYISFILAQSLTSGNVVRTGKSISSGNPRELHFLIPWQDTWTLFQVRSIVGLSIYLCVCAGADDRNLGSHGVFAYIM